MIWRLGMATGSGIYSLALRFLVCCGGGWLCEVNGGRLGSLDSAELYILRLCIIADEGSRDESAGLVPRTESSPTLPSLSLDFGGVPGISFFQGPGESAESSGLGSGVMSPMADIIGLATALLAPLAVPPSA